MDAVAERLLRTRVVTDNAGNELPLHSFTPLAQGEYLQSLIRSVSAKSTLEVGFAYGISTLFICEELRKQDGDAHYVIDPYQESWRDIGLRNVEEAGYSDLLRFFREESYVVLPRLLRETVVIDFAYVDTTKVFDHVLVDVFFIQRLLRVGGIFALDDCTFPGLRKLARMLAQLPSLRVHSTFGESKQSGAMSAAHGVLGRLPAVSRLVSPRVMRTDAELGVNAHCIAFEKVAEDERPWDWFEDF